MLACTRRRTPADHDEERGLEELEDGDEAEEFGAGGGHAGRLGQLMGCERLAAKSAMSRLCNLEVELVICLEISDATNGEDPANARIGPGTHHRHPRFQWDFKHSPAFRNFK